MVESRDFHVRSNASNRGGTVAPT